MSRLARRGWVPEPCEDYVQRIAAETEAAGAGALAERSR